MEEFLQVPGYPDMKIVVHQAQPFRSILDMSEAEIYTAKCLTRLGEIRERAKAINDEEERLVEEAMAILQPEIDTAKEAEDVERLKYLMGLLPDVGLGEVHRHFIMDAIRVIAKKNEARAQDITSGGVCARCSFDPHAPKDDGHALGCTERQERGPHAQD